MDGLARFEDADVAAAFAAFPDSVRDNLLHLRELILNVAAETSEIGPLQETLKWGQPAYLPKRPRVGTTVRLGVPRNNSNQFAMFFHCQTTLVEQFRELYPGDFAFQGNRAIIFDGKKPLAQDEIRHCIAKALTYHIKTTPR